MDRFFSRGRGVFAWSWVVKVTEKRRARMMGIIIYKIDVKGDGVNI